MCSALECVGCATVDECRDGKSFRHNGVRVSPVPGRRDITCSRCSASGSCIAALLFLGASRSLPRTCARFPLRRNLHRLITCAHFLDFGNYPTLGSSLRCNPVVYLFLTKSNPILLEYLEFQDYLYILGVKYLFVYLEESLTNHDTVFKNKN